MNNKPVNPILGTFVIEEHDGKKYKMMFVEEIAAEPSVETVEKASLHLEGVELSNNPKVSNSIPF